MLAFLLRFEINKINVIVYLYKNFAVPPSVGNFQPNDLNTTGIIEIPEVTNNSVIQLYLEVPHQFQMIGVLLGKLSVSTVTIIDDSCMLVLVLST